MCERDNLPLLGWLPRRCSFFWPSFPAAELCMTAVEDVILSQAMYSVLFESEKDEKRPRRVPFTVTTDKDRESIFSTFLSPVGFALSSEVIAYLILWMTISNTCVAQRLNADVTTPVQSATTVLSFLRLHLSARSYISCLCLQSYVVCGMYVFSTVDVLFSGSSYVVTLFVQWSI